MVHNKFPYVYTLCSYFYKHCNCCGLNPVTNREASPPFPDSPVDLCKKGGMEYVSLGDWPYEFVRKGKGKKGEFEDKREVLNLV